MLRTFAHQILEPATFYLPIGQEGKDSFR